MHWFFYEFTPQYPYTASAIKFMLLGTLGEYIGAVIRTKYNWKSFPLWKFFPKILIWAFLGLLVKWSFSSFVILIPAQAAKGLLPQASAVPGTFLFALAISIEMNIFFGPFMMSLHRAMDNLIDRRWNWKGMDIAIYSLFWFWIPIHIITFLLPVNFQIFFAASLSVVLGIILGFATR